jgi:hypothetical protein
VDGVDGTAPSSVVVATVVVVTVVSLVVIGTEELGVVVDIPESVGGKIIGLLFVVLVVVVVAQRPRVLRIMPASIKIQ